MGDLHKERFIVISGPHTIRIVIIILMMRAGESSGQKSSKLPSTRVLSLSRHLHSCLILVFLPDDTLQIVKVHFWTYHQKMAELSVCSFLFQEIFFKQCTSKVTKDIIFVLIFILVCAVPSTTRMFLSFLFHSIGTDVTNTALFL